MILLLTRFYFVVINSIFFIVYVTDDLIIWNKNIITYNHTMVLVTLYSKLLYAVVTTQLNEEVPVRFLIGLILKNNIQIGCGLYVLVLVLQG